jgi:alkylhydroperoxidase family enzyme
MRTSTPRIPPLTDDELKPEQEALIAPLRATGRDFNINRMFARHPAAQIAFRYWATHVFYSDNNTMRPREREILVQRTAWRVKCGYVWSRHMEIARAAGLRDDEIEACKRPIEEGNWSARDAVLLKAADALVADYFIPDDIWAELSAHFDDKQCMDAIFSVGLYSSLAMLLNSAGLQIDHDVTLDPDLDARA